MSEKWLVLEEGLHPTILQRIEMDLRKIGIEYRTDEREEGYRLLIEGTKENERALDRVHDLIDAYRITIQNAQEEGVTIRPYKRLEPHTALFAALRAHGSADEKGVPVLLTELLHEFVWTQPLPNANHRSAFLLVVELANRQGIAVESEDKILEIGNAFAQKSKPLIAEKEFLPDLAEEKSAHREAAREAIGHILKSV